MTRAATVDGHMESSARARVVENRRILIAYLRHLLPYMRHIDAYRTRRSFVIEDPLRRLKGILQAVSYSNIQAPFPDYDVTWYPFRWGDNKYVYLKLKQDAAVKRGRISRKRAFKLTGHTLVEANHSHRLLDEATRPLSWNRTTP